MMISSVLRVSSSLLIFLNQIFSSFNPTIEEDTQTISDYQFEFQKIKIHFLRDVLTPLAQFSIGASKFSYNSHGIDLNFPLKAFKFFNLTTLHWDYVMESFSSHGLYNSKRFDLKVQAPINLTFSYNAIIDSLDYFQEFQDRSFRHDFSNPPLQQLKILNHIGAKLKIYIESFSRTIHDNNFEFFHIIRESDLILFKFPGSKEFSISMSELRPPKFFAKSILVSFSWDSYGQLLTFSSLVRIKNRTSEDLNFFAKNIKIPILSRTTVYLPFSFPLSSSFDITPNESTSSYMFSLRSLRDHNNSLTSKHLILTSKVGTKNPRFTIFVYHTITLINQLPFPIQIISNSLKSKISVPQESSFSTSYNNTKESKNYISIAIEGTSSTARSNFSFIDGEKVLLSTTCLMVAMEIEREADTHIFKMIFYAPVLVFNRSSFLLKCENSQEKRKYDFLPFKPGIGICFWGSYLFFDVETQSVPLVLSFNNARSSPIECLGIGISSDIFIPCTLR